jgi:hypothetical protein
MIMNGELERIAGSYCFSIHQEEIPTRHRDSNRKAPTYKSEVNNLVIFSYDSSIILKKLMGITKTVFKIYTGTRDSGRN